MRAPSRPRRQMVAAKESMAASGEVYEPGLTVLEWSGADGVGTAGQGESAAGRGSA
ncbi:hypothetical protein [Streptomyces sp. NPDC096132]|uniref:hypothetical protein n=1 Tax=Streptomyces sp. NPDC096132 TaxID=3366075 RepID=UPI00381903BD